MGGIGLVVTSREVSGLKLSCISTDHQLTTDIEISECSQTGDDSSHISSFRGRQPRISDSARSGGHQLVLAAMRERGEWSRAEERRGEERRGEESANWNVDHTERYPTSSLKYGGCGRAGWLHNNELDSSVTVTRTKIMFVYITISHWPLHFSWVANCEQLVSSGSVYRLDNNLNG